MREHATPQLNLLLGRPAADVPGVQPDPVAQAGPPEIRPGGVDHGLRQVDAVDEDQRVGARGGGADS